MTSRLFLGRLTALIGRRKLLITGTLVAAVALAGASLPVSVAVITILMPLAGLGLGVGQPITMSWLAASAPSGARGRAMSLRLVGNRAGQVVLPSLAGALAAGTEAAGVLCATGAKLAVIAAAARTLSVDEPRNPQPHADSVTRGGRTAPSAAVPPLFADTAELSLRRP
jgi:MFS family permease